jgi:hypothetical protein
VVEVEPACATRTVLQWLREDAHCTGTKEGCAEGDCGACTVVLGELDEAGGLRLAPINACIRFLPTLDGKALFTVEDLAPPGAAAPGAAKPGGLPRLAMRLLHAGLRDEPVGQLPTAPGGGTRAEPPGTGRHAQRQPLPLHRLPAHPGRRPAHVRSPGHRPC